MAKASDTSRFCKRCIEAKEIPKRTDICQETEDVVQCSTSRHCRCSLLLPDEDLMTKIRDGQPYRKYEIFIHKNKDEKQSLELEKVKNRENDEEQARKDLKQECNRFKSNTHHVAVKLIQEMRQKQTNEKKAQRDKSQATLDGFIMKSSKESKAKKPERKRKRSGIEQISPATLGLGVQAKTLRK